MKKWMKWNAGNEPITEQDVVAIAAIGMLLGGVIVWFVFAAFWGYRVFEDAGSGADWAAALATGVVGWGAWKYAKEAHNQRVSESKRRADAELIDAATRLFFMRQWAYALKRAKQINDATKKKVGDKFSVDAFHGLLDGSEKVLDRIDFNDPTWLLLGQKWIQLKMEIPVVIDLYVITMNVFRKNYPREKSTLLSDIPERDLKHLLHGIDRLDELGDRLESAIKEAEGKLKIQLQTARQLCGGV